MGPLADKLNKRSWVIICSLGCCASVLLLTLPIENNKLYVYLLYISAFIQFSFDCLSTSLRSSMIPLLVTQKDLQVTTTLDSLAWSTIGAFGASLGGIICKILGVKAAFLIDALTFLMVAYLYTLIPDPQVKTKYGPLSHIEDNADEMPDGDVNVDVEMHVVNHLQEEYNEDSRAYSSVCNNGVESEIDINNITDNSVYSRNDKDGDILFHKEVDKNSYQCELSSTNMSKNTKEDNDDFNDNGTEEQSQSRDDDSTPKYLAEFILAEETFQPIALSHIEMLREGWMYISLNKKVFFVCSMKGCGAMVWGASDLLAVKISQLDTMHSLGDTSITLGLMYSAVGVGCQLGPIIWNNCTKQEETALFMRVIASFLNMIISYYIFSVSKNIYPILFGVLVRCFGSSTLWTYSSLLIQLLVPSHMQGRIFTFERFLYTLFEISSILLGSLLFDVLMFDIVESSLIMCCIGIVFFVAWCIIYVYLFVF